MARGTTTPLNGRASAGVPAALGACAGLRPPRHAEPREPRAKRHGPALAPPPSRHPRRPASRASGRQGGCGGAILRERGGAAHEGRAGGGLARPGAHHAPPPGEVRAADGGAVPAVDESSGEGGVIPFRSQYDAPPKRIRQKSPKRPQKDRAPVASSAYGYLCLAHPVYTTPGAWGPCSISSYMFPEVLIYRPLSSSAYSYFAQVSRSLPRYW